LNGSFEFTGVQNDLDTLVGGVGNDIYFIDRFNRTTGVQDTIVELADEGTDTVFYSGNTLDELTYVLGDNLENLTLGQNGVALNGIGNGLANVIIGNDQNNSITGGGEADTLTGGLGADTFVYTNLSDSLLANFDRITRFDVANDRIDVSAAVVGFAPLPPAANNATSLDAGAIGAVLTNVSFVANIVTTFTVANTRTFIAINNAIDGYDSTTDAIIEITGFIGGNPLVGITLV
jgi:Ca2+-binding RTX toxin-like protein